MFCHDSNQLFIAEIPVRHILAIGGFVRPHRIMWPHAGNVQQSLQLIGRQRPLDVVDTFELHAFCSQDPLDFAALRSRWLLVNNDFSVDPHCSLLMQIAIFYVCCRAEGAFTTVNHEGNAYKSNQARQLNPVKQLLQTTRSPARKNTSIITNIP